jgi:hypothetical protein
MTNTTEEEAARENANGFLTKVAAKLDDFTEVRVVTIVGDVPVTFKSKGGEKGTTVETTIEDVTIEKGALVTIVKLLDGDVTTAIPPAQVENAEVREMHAAQVAESLKVLPENIKSIVEIAKSIMRAL